MLKNGIEVWPKKKKYRVKKQAVSLQHSAKQATASVLSLQGS